MEMNDILKIDTIARGIMANYYVDQDRNAELIMLNDGLILYYKRREIFKAD